MTGLPRCSFAGPAGSHDLLLAGLEGDEGLSQLFEYKVKVLSPKGELLAHDWLGEPLTVLLPYGMPQKMRILHTHICSFRRIADQARMSCYELVLRPWLWFSTCTSDCRIFQNQTVLEVLKVVLAKYPGEVEWLTTESYTSLEYCVQYGETDFEFVSRLLEDAGLYYFFKHSIEGHRLVICDSMSVHKSLEDHEVFRWRISDDHFFSSLWNWELEENLCSGRVISADFDFTKANTREASVLQADATVAMAHAQASYEHYRYPGNFKDLAAGEAAAKIQLEAIHAEQQLVSAHSCAPYLLPGACFDLDEHPDDSQNVQYLIVYAHLRAECSLSNYGVSSPSFSCRLKAIRSNARYRPELRTPRPKIFGPQTAFVAGKEGEPLWVDEFGRIKIQFHWDRSKQNNENCSCWVRVAQAWAGQRWGAIFLPRVGQEVLVEFLDGNPDRPLVTGSLYNGGMLPPYELPAQVARSGIKSQSLGAEDIYNELRFDDKDGAEQLFFHAGRNQDVIVRNDAMTTIGHDHHLKVGASSFCKVIKDAHEQIGGDHNRQVTADHSLEVGGDNILQVKGEYSQDIAEDHYSLVGGSYSLDISADSEIKVGGKLKLGAGSSVDIKGSQTITLEAGQTLTLKAGSSALVLGPKGVSINGALVTIDAKDKVDINSGSGGTATSAEEPKPKKTQTPKKAEEPKDASCGCD
ncbi:type VI secretion system Vgr family protein [Aeromonas jandaei]|uniref:type VI secretion system Vgr family protein n=1 Tax=Aeromonas jandaei TaxID=650 RepID=UPI003D194688